jgi:osmotically-inducible protein OsmY
VTGSEGPVRRINAALVADGRIDTRDGGVHVGWSHGAVVLTGQVARLRDKRLAEHVARLVAPDVPIRNCLMLDPMVERPDEELRVRVLNALEQDPNLNLTALSVTAEHGVVTLSGLAASLVTKRVAGVIAWWTTGVRDVRNLIEVSPPEEDGDREITDAVQAVLEKDPLVDSDEVLAHTDGGIVILQGTVCSQLEKDAAENDAWFIWGVTDVLNALQLAPPRSDRERTDYGGREHGSAHPYSR